MAELEASGLAQVRFQGEATKGFVVMILTDTKQKHFATMVNSEALNALLSPLLGLAAQWADEPDLEIDTLVGPQNALPGTKIEFAQGRTPKECAVRIFVGKIELSFLIPLDDVLSSTATLVQSIEDDPGKRLH